MYFPKQVFTRRIERLQEKMKESRLGGIIIPPGPNFFYFTGMETESMERFAALIITEKRICVLCPKLMASQVLEESWINDIIPWSDGTNPFTELGRIFPSEENIGLDGQIPYFHFDELRRSLNRTFELSDQVVSTLRTTKGQEELEVIREATRLSEKSLMDVMTNIEEGITEKQLARLLENSFLENGLDSPAFSTIIAFGKNSAMPHHNVNSTKLKKEDSIIIDYGGRYHGYASDNTRTFFYDRPSEKMEQIYEAVREANESARAQISDSTSYAQMDKIARDIITSKGYGDKFIHRLGHGLGISVHEPPYLVPENIAQVKTNSVFTIEPGVYIDELGGVRIEDTNYFDGTKCVPFNTMTREMMIL